MPQVTWVERIGSKQLGIQAELEKWRKKETKKPPPEGKKVDLLSRFETLFPKVKVTDDSFLGRLRRPTENPFRKPETQPIETNPFRKLVERPSVLKPSMGWKEPPSSPISAKVTEVQPFPKFPAGAFRPLTGREIKPPPLPPPEVPPMPKADWLDRVKELQGNPAQLVPFVSSGVEIVTLGKLLKTANDFNVGREVSREDLLSLKEYVDRSNRDTTWGYKVADVVTQIVPFAGEFVATGGIFAVGKTAAVKASTLALKKLATKTGAKLLERKLAQMGVQAVGTVAGGTLRAIATSPVRVSALTMGKQLQGKLTGNEESVLDSAKKAFGEHWVEIVSESTGGMFGVVANPIKGKLIKAGLFKAFLKANPAKEVSTASKVFNRMGYHGVLGEILEERVAEVGHGILQPLGLSGQQFSLPSLEQLSIELAAFSIPGVAMKAVEGIPSAMEQLRIAPERGGLKLPKKPEVPAVPEMGKTVEIGKGQYQVTDLRTGKVSVVKGRPIIVKGFEEYEFFVSRPLDFEGKPSTTLWTVFEKTTGFSTGISANTQIKAIQDAQQRLTAIGKAKLDEAIGKVVAPAVPEKVAQKEAWQMTKAEYLKSPMAKGVEPAKFRPYGEYTGSKRDYLVSSHRFEVEKALSEGKPVPAEVLKDYPDLVAKQAPTPIVERPVVAPVTPEVTTPEVEARREQMRRDLMSQEDTIKKEIMKEIRSYQPMGKMSEVGEVLGVRPAKGQLVSTPFGSYVFAKARLPDAATITRWADRFKEAEELGRRAATETTFMVVEPGLTTGNIRELEQGRRLKARGLLSPRELKYVDALEEFWAKYPNADYGVVQPDGSIKLSTRFKPVKPEVAIPKAEAGMPEAGLQPSMLGEVPFKEVRPAGKGVVTQISMEDQLKLQQARQAAVEAEVAELAPTAEELYEMQGELEGLKSWLETEPAAKLTNLIKKVGWSKGEVNNLTKQQYRDITGREPKASSFAPETQTVTAKAHTTKAGKYVPERTYKVTRQVIPWEYALDDVATEMGYESSDALKEAIERAGTAQSRIKQLESEVRTQMTEKPLELLPEPTAEEVALTPTGEKVLTPVQVARTLELFGKYVESSSAINAWELTRELRRETRAGQAENLKARAQELIVEKGIDAEEGMRQAIRETLSGELPVMRTDYLDDLTNRMRAILFNKVFTELKDDPFEMASTLTALTNALTGRAIPREVGVKGGSAYTRLQRVFGDQPEVLKALDKMASEKKPLQDVVEGIFHETGRAPIPIDQELADYLRGLQDIPYGYKTLLEKPFVLPSLPIDTRTAHQKSIDLQNFKLELTPDIWKDWTPERLEEMSYLRINLLKTEYQTKLAEAGWTPPSAIADQRTAAQRALDLDLFKISMAKAPTPVTPYEAPIEKAIKQITYWPTPVRDRVIGFLKELAWSPVDIGNFLRAMKSSVDQSYWRQIMPLIVGHPTRFALSNVDAWAGTISEKSAKAQWERITKSPLYAIYDALQAKSGRDFLRPLDLAKGVAQWKGVEEYGYLTKNRLIPRLTAKIPTIKWSNRGFVSGVNSDTWGIFEDFHRLMLRKAELYASGKLILKEGEAFDIMGAMDAEATKLADWTGRASLGGLAPAAPAISAVIYAPRYALGRAIGPRHLFSANSYVRKEAWKDAALFVGAIGGTLLLGRQLGWWDVETDVRSADFMKIRIGNLRIDPWGGAQQFVVFFAKVSYIMAAPITGKPATAISTTTGREYPMDFMRLTENFIKSKEAPLAAAFLEYMTGKTYGGEKVDVKNLKQWADRIAPMSIQDIWEGIMVQPETAVIGGILGFTGFGVQTYKGKDLKTPKLPTKPTGRRPFREEGVVPAPIVPRGMRPFKE